MDRRDFLAVFLARLCSRSATAMPRRKPMPPAARVLPTPPLLPANGAADYDDREVHQRSPYPRAGTNEDGPVGAFRLDIGPETPTFYVLIPARRPHSAGPLELDLAQDAELCESRRAFLERASRVARFSADRLVAAGGIRGLAADYAARERQTHLSTPHLREPQLPRSHSQGTDVSLRRIRDFQERRISAWSSLATR